MQPERTATANNTQSIYFIINNPPFFYFFFLYSQSQINDLSESEFLERFLSAISVLSEFRSSDRFLNKNEVFS